MKRPNARQNSGPPKLRRLASRWWPTAVSTGCTCACIVTGSWWWLIPPGAVYAIAFWLWRRDRRNHVLGLLAKLDKGDEEKRARAQADMPASHPEKLTAELGVADEESLAELCAALWPDDEYAREIEYFGRES